MKNELFGGVGEAVSLYFAAQLKLSYERGLTKGENECGIPLSAACLLFP